MEPWTLFSLVPFRKALDPGRKSSRFIFKPHRCLLQSQQQGRKCCAGVCGNRLKKALTVRSVWECVCVTIEVKKGWSADLICTVERQFLEDVLDLLLGGFSHGNEFGC